MVFISFKFVKTEDKNTIIYPLNRNFYRNFSAFAISGGKTFKIGNKKIKQLFCLKSNKKIKDYKCLRSEKN